MFIWETELSHSYLSFRRMKNFNHWIAEGAARHLKLFERRDWSKGHCKGKILPQISILSYFATKHFHKTAFQTKGSVMFSLKSITFPPYFRCLICCCEAKEWAELVWFLLYICLLYIQWALLSFCNTCQITLLYIKCGYLNKTGHCSSHVFHFCAITTWIVFKLTSKFSEIEAAVALA